MTRPRIVVTGVGLVTSLGASAASTMPRLLGGDRGFAPATVLPTEGYATTLVAEALGLWDALGARRSQPPVWSRSDALAVVACAEALAQAGQFSADVRRELWLGASTGGMLETEHELTRVFRGDPPPSDPATLLRHPISSPGDRAHAAFGPFRQVRTLCSACSSGAVSLGLALDRLRLGRADMILAGGVDAMSRLTFSGFSALASLDPRGSRPFDADRQGLTLGEGAAFFVLEREVDALARGAIVLGELAGFAVACEAHHITAPEPGGATAEKVMRAALADSGRNAADIGYVNAHGTGTQLNDAMEADAIARLLGDRAASVAVSSQKGQLGHTLSAAGSVEAAVTWLAMCEGKVPPNGGLTVPDPAAKVHLVGATAEAADVDLAISNSFGFGGTDATLVLARSTSRSPALPAIVADELVITGVCALGGLGSLRGGEAARYAGASAPDDPRDAEDPRAKLDPASIRRMDLGARYAVFLAREALADSGLKPGERVGLVTGSAFASSDASAAFFARIEDKGPRFASPLEFPNLVPSSPGAHAAIALGIKGPVLAVADLGVTAFASLATAMDLLDGGRADAVIAMSAETPNVIAVRMLSGAVIGVGEGPRGSGGGALVVERSTSAAARGAVVLAKLAGAGSVRGPIENVALTPPRPGAKIFVPRATPFVCSMITALGWADASVVEVSATTGWHEASSAVALVAGVACVSRGDTSDALVLHGTPDRIGFAHFIRP